MTDIRKGIIAALFVWAAFIVATHAETTIVTPAPGDVVIVNIPAATQPAPTPDPVEPQPEPVPDVTPVVKLPSKLTPGATYNLSGAETKLTAPITVPKGKLVTISNGRFVFMGKDGAKTGSWENACFNVGAGAALRLEDCKFKIAKRGTPAKVTVGGWLSMVNLEHDNGAIVWCEGGKLVEIINPVQTGVPDKYWICNFSFQLDHLRIVTTKANPIRQGKSEAAVRLMQVEESEIRGLKVIGSGYKQAVQDRPGGAPGSTYEKHVWIDCEVSGGVDLGNFKDTNDKNYPFGRLKLSQWIDCKVDRFTKTFDGRGAFGIDRVEIQ